MFNEELMTRASKWTIHTIQINHKYRQLIPLSVSKSISNKHDRYLIAVGQAKTLKKYILIYVCYLFGASYQNCRINKFKINNERTFYKKQLINFFKVVKNYYYNPEQSMQYFDYAQDSFGKRHKLVNSTIFSSHLPKLTKVDIETLVDFFIRFRNKNKHMSKIFHGARHYFNLEEQGFFYKLKNKHKKKSLVVKLFTARLKTKDFKHFQKSGLSKKIALRNSYFHFIKRNKYMMLLFVSYQAAFNIKATNINKIIKNKKEILDLIGLS